MRSGACGLDIASLFPHFCFFLIVGPWRGQGKEGNDWIVGPLRWMWDLIARVSSITFFSQHCRCMTKLNSKSMVFSCGFVLSAACHEPPSVHIYTYPYFRTIVGLACAIVTATLFSKWQFRRDFSGPLLCVDEHVSCGEMCRLDRCSRTVPVEQVFFLQRVTDRLRTAFPFFV